MTDASDMIIVAICIVLSAVRLTRCIIQGYTAIVFHLRLPICFFLFVATCELHSIQRESTIAYTLGEFMTVNGLKDTFFASC